MTRPNVRLPASLTAANMKTETVELDGVWRNERPQTAEVTKAASIQSPANPPAFIDMTELMDLLGVGWRVVAKVIEEPYFPKAVRLGPRCRRWIRHEVIQAIANHAPRESGQVEPQELQQARARRKSVRQ